MGVILELYVTVFISLLTTSYEHKTNLSRTSVEYTLDVDTQRNRSDPHRSLGGGLTSGTDQVRNGQRSLRSGHTFGDGTDTLKNPDYSGQQRVFPDVPSPHGYRKASSGIHNANDLDCSQTMSTLKCKTIPDWIPKDITTLIVTFQDTAIPDNIFQNTSFSDLKHLFLNGVGLNEFSETSFVGLDNARNLTLTGMSDLHGSSLQSAISGVAVLQNMKFLAVNPGSEFAPPFLKLDNEFMAKLSANKIDCFNLSNVIVEFNFPEWFTYVISYNLSVLNWTGSFLAIDYSHPFDDSNQLPNYSLRNPPVKVLDVSRIRTTNITGSKSVMNGMYANIYGDNSQCNVTPMTLTEFVLVESLYLRDTFTNLRNYEGYCDLSTKYRNIFLKKVVVSGNYIQKLNMSIVLPPINTFHYADLSNNKVEYIGPGMFKTWLAMEELYLSNNQLYHMQYLPEFETLLTSLKRLSALDLANNNITYIPPNMFQNNTQLQRLILANNNLKAITFDLELLTKLLILDIRDNAIVTLDNNALNKMQLIFKARHEHLAFMFAGNPIQCSCESVEFITWLVSLQNVTKERIICAYGNNNINVDKKAVNKCKFLCHKPLIIAVSTVCSIIVLLLCLSALASVRRNKIRKEKTNVEMRLKKIINEGNFMCFMSISGDDESLVEVLIVNYLQPLLKRKLGLNRNLVCTGTRFKPGFAICEEAHRLMKKCQVFVAVVSESFLRSQYCQFEFQEACKQKKPTILIFLGHVNIEDMPQYMQDVFRRNSRAWIKQNEDGYYYLVPNQIDMSEAIWDLAIADLLNNY